MNNFNKILRGKTKDEIISSLCDKFDIPYDSKEADDISKMNKIIPIVVHNKNIYNYANLEFEYKSVNVDKENFIHGAVYDDNDIPIITTRIVSKDLKITKKILDWKKIYVYLLKLISDKGNFLKFKDFVIKIKKDIVSNQKVISNTEDVLKNIYLLANYYTTINRRGPNIIIMPIELEKFFPDKIDNFNIIFDENVENIIIGKKNDMSEKGFMLVKYQDRYSLFEPDNLNELYVKTKYVIEDEDKQY